MNRNYCLLILACILLNSCSYWMAPPYTSVDKMLAVEKGMNPSQVDEKLGIKPYNILHTNDSTSVFEYHYRLKDRDVNNIKNYDQFIHTDASQVGGKLYFDKPSKFYILFENNKFSSIITANGLENSDYLLLKNNNLMLVSQSDLVNFKLNESVGYLNRIDNTQKLKAKKTLRHSVLYSMNLPYGAVGLKYALAGKVGGYVSSALSIDYEMISYLTGGFVLRTGTNSNIYLGGGAGPYIWKDNYEGWEELNMDDFVIEAGALFHAKRISFDVGLGYGIDNESPYAKLGFGFNF